MGDLDNGLDVEKYFKEKDPRDMDENFYQIYNYEDFYQNHSVTEPCDEKELYESMAKWLRAYEVEDEQMGVASGKSHSLSIFNHKLTVT